MSCRVIRSPQTLEELAQSLTLYDTLQSNLSKVESQIMPIHDQFEILKKYEVAVEESVSIPIYGLIHTKCRPPGCLAWSTIAFHISSRNATADRGEIAIIKHKR